MNWRIILSVVLLSTVPTAAQATPCVNPPGDEGDQVYNITYHVMQYCNGSHWVAMGSIMGQGDGLGDHMAGQALDMGGFQIQNLAPPTADNHAATRAYVTTAIERPTRCLFAIVGLFPFITDSAGALLPPGAIL